MNRPPINYAFRPSAIILISIGLLGHSMAASLVVTNNFITDIPDDDPNGIASIIVATTPIQSIESISISLSIESSFAMWNGDYYAYLVHGSGFVVLLNRSGRSATNPDGYADSGFEITLEDIAAADIHLYQDTLDPASGVLTGHWQPDRREIDPGSSLDSTARGSGLSVFNGSDPNGNWTLFLADTAAGGEGRLLSWTLTIEGQVPEPSTALMAAGGLLFACFQRRRSTGVEVRPNV